VFDPQEYHVMSGDSVNGRGFARIQPGVVPGLTIVGNWMPRISPEFGFGHRFYMDLQ